MNNRAPYSGTSRKLVIALDVGTTFSGISYSILDPGEIPKISPVTKFPFQSYTGTDCKIPSIIYYDERGIARAFAAQALQREIREKANKEGWVLSEWFKLHLRLQALPADHIYNHNIPNLPFGKTVVSVFADFLGYLYRCTKEYIEAQPAGRELWRSFGQQIDFVLSHPNGWEGAQQSQMRRAAVFAGLIPGDLQSESRIHFVTEGEASLHFCAENISTMNAIKQGDGLIVVDAGGGTIDLSAYYASDLERHLFEEIAVPECRFQGSIFVSLRATKYLRGKLRQSKYGDPFDIKAMTEDFDKEAKTTFRDPKQISYIKFGGRRDNDESVAIKDGEIKLTGMEVANLFEPSIKATIDAIQVQRQAASKPIRLVLLVGGFAANDWLFSSLKSSFKSLGLEISRPDRYQNKSVSDGAVSFYLKRLVDMSMAQWTFGVKVMTEYDDRNPDHTSRSRTLVSWPSGRRLLPGHWSSILKKGTRVYATKEFRQSYCMESFDPCLFNSIEDEIKCYRGNWDFPPSWMDEDPGMFPTICKVVADTSEIVKTLPGIEGPSGTYYHLSFDIVLSYGLTEHRAQISWQENGEEKRSSAVLVYVDF